MSDARNIQIQIAATGGDQAAGEIRKVDSAVDSDVVSIRKLNEELAEAKRQFESAAVGSDEFTAAAKRLDAAKKNLAASTRTVSASSLDMRSSMSNVGYQIQDFAVQVGMGTSALRAFSQQAPQLLSAFGPWGVMAGTIIALGAPLAAAFMAPGDSAEKSKDKVDSLTDILEDYADAGKKASQSKDVANITAWLDALDDEEEKIRRNNEATEASIQLQTKLTALKDGVETARRNLLTAEITADPNMSESDKTRAIAGIKQAEARAKAQSEIEKLTGASDAAGRNYESAQGIADRRKKDADAAAAEVERIKAERADQANAAREAKDLQKEIDKNQSDREAAIRSADEFNTPDLGKFDAREKELQDKLKSALDRAGGDTDEKRIQRKDSLAAQEQEAKSKEKEIKGDAEKAAQAAKDAYAEMLRRQAEARESVPLIGQRYTMESRAREVEAEAKAREQEAAARKRADDERDRKEREAKEDRRRERTDAIAAAALGMDASMVSFDVAGGRAQAAIKRKAEALLRNPTASGQAELMDLIERLIAITEKKGEASEVASLKQKVATLEARQKNGRDGR